MLGDHIKIACLGHACFKLEFAGYSLIIDPYKDGMIPGLPPLRVEADAVYCSHGHDDHAWVKAVTLKSSGAESPFGVWELITPHDDAGGAKRGMNTVRVFSAGGLRVAHMGDIGRPLTDPEAETLKGVDALLIPIGGVYTIDAAQARDMVDIINPRLTIPMHFRNDDFGFPVIGRIEEFTKFYGEVGYAGSEIELRADTPRGVVVMTPAI